MKRLWYYHFPFEPLPTLSLAEDDIGICDLFFGRAKLPPGIVEMETPRLQEAAIQLSEYFSGARTAFSVPLSFHGTVFQEAVWNALRIISYGETRSYKDIAVQIGNPKAVRAIGMANHRNPLPIFLPCHRVIGSDGSLVGYGGGLNLKVALLNLEKSNLEHLENKPEGQKYGKNQ